MTEDTSRRFSRHARCADLFAYSGSVLGRRAIADSRKSASPPSSSACAAMRLSCLWWKRRKRQRRSFAGIFSHGSSSTGGRSIQPFGVLCLVRVGDCPARCPDHEIDRLKALIDGHGFIRLPEAPPPPPRRKIAIGARVKITGGPFEGRLGLYAGMDRRSVNGSSSIFSAADAPSWSAPFGCSGMTLATISPDRARYIANSADVAAKERRLLEVLREHPGLTDLRSSSSRAITNLRPTTACSGSPPEAQSKRMSPADGALQEEGRRRRTTNRNPTPGLRTPGRKIRRGGSSRCHATSGGRRRSSRGCDTARGSAPATSMAVVVILQSRLEIRSLGDAFNVRQPEHRRRLSLVAP